VCLAQHPYGCCGVTGLMSLFEFGKVSPELTNVSINGLLCLLSSNAFRIITLVFVIRLMPKRCSIQSNVSFLSIILIYCANSGRHYTCYHPTISTLIRQGLSGCVSMQAGLVFNKNSELTMGLDTGSSLRP